MYIDTNEYYDLQYSDITLRNGDRFELICDTSIYCAEYVNIDVYNLTDLFYIYSSVYAGIIRCNINLYNVNNSLFDCRGDSSCYDSVIRHNNVNNNKIICSLQSACAYTEYYCKTNDEQVYDNDNNITCSIECTEVSLIIQFALF